MLPYYKTNANNISADDEYTVVPISAGNSFQENLIAQLGLGQFRVILKQKLQIK